MLASANQPASQPLYSVCAKHGYALLVQSHLLFIAAGWLIVGELLTYFSEKEKKSTFKQKRRKMRRKKNHSPRSAIGVRATQTNLRSYTQYKRQLFVCYSFYYFLRPFVWALGTSIYSREPALIHSNSLKRFNLKKYSQTQSQAGWVRWNTHLRTLESIFAQIHMINWENI